MMGIYDIIIYILYFFLGIIMAIGYLSTFILTIIFYKYGDTIKKKFVTERMIWWYDQLMPISDLVACFIEIFYDLHVYILKKCTNLLEPEPINQEPIKNDNSQFKGFIKSLKRLTSSFWKIKTVALLYKKGLYFFNRFKK